jgi:hypothetical protein
MVGKNISNNCITAAMAYDPKKKSEQLIQGIRNNMMSYEKAETYRNKEGLQDRLLSHFGGTNVKNLVKATKNSNYSAKVNENDAKIMNALTQLYTDISIAKNKSPDFYKKASRYIDIISNATTKLSALRPADSREGICYVITLLLNRFEEDVGIVTEGEGKDLNEHLNLKAREDAEQSFENRLKAIQEASKATGRSVDETVKEMEDFVDQYALSKKSRK